MLKAELSGGERASMEKKFKLLFRVYAAADGSDSEAPVLVVVRHEKGVLSWQVRKGLFIQGGFFNCPPPKNHKF